MTDAKEQLHHIDLQSRQLRRQEMKLFGNGAFPGQDFQFYFLNLRKNAKTRIDKLKLNLL